MKKRLGWLLASLMLLCGCPPPVEFNILNNTGEKLVLHTPSGAIVLEPGMAVELGEHELLLSKSEGKYTYPVLHIEHLNCMWEYYVPLRGDEEWRRGWTFLIQVDLDLAIRIAKPKDKRPVTRGYPQPEDWPLTASAEITAKPGEKQR